MFVYIAIIIINIDINIDYNDNTIIIIIIIIIIICPQPTRWTPSGFASTSPSVAASLVIVMIIMISIVVIIVIIIVVIIVIIIVIIIGETLLAHVRYGARGNILTPVHITGTYIIMFLYVYGLIMLLGPYYWYMCSYIMFSFSCARGNILTHRKSQKCTSFGERAADDSFWVSGKHSTGKVTILWTNPISVVQYVCCP